VKAREREGVSPRTRSLGAEFRAWSASVLDPIGASGLQRQETRRAWYAGASAMFGLMAGATPGGAGLDDHDDEDAAYVEGLHQELRRFARDLTEHRA